MPRSISFETATPAMREAWVRLQNAEAELQRLKAGERIDRTAVRDEHARAVEAYRRACRGAGRREYPHLRPPIPTT